MSEIGKPRFNAYWNIVRIMERLGSHFHQALRRWQAQRTAAALENLDDDVLRDIGITRGEIPALALRVTAPVGPPAVTARTAAHPASGREATI